jgi:hypothetical protein
MGDDVSAAGHTPHTIAVDRVVIESAVAVDAAQARRLVMETVAALWQPGGVFYGAPPPGAAAARAAIAQALGTALSSPGSDV